MQKFLLLLFWAFSSVVLAYSPQEGNVTTTLGPYIFRTNDTGSEAGVHSPFLGGVGLTVNGDANAHGSLEISLFHLNKLYMRTQDGTTLVEKSALLKINMGYRYWWTNWFSSSPTFYSSYSLGEPKVVQKPPSANFESSAHATTLYGFDLALQEELWSSGRYALVLEERYAKSITSRSGESGDDYGVLIGLRYFVQAKQVLPGPSPKK
jgi:hypothetical protein